MSSSAAQLGQLPEIAYSQVKCQLRPPFEMTRREVRMHTVISYGTLATEGQGLQRVVVKMFREGGDVTVEKVARVSLLHCIWGED